MKKSTLTFLIIDVIFIIGLAILNIFIQASWLSYAYVALMLVGIFLNNEKRKEGMLVYAAASAVYTFISFGEAFLGDFILNAVFVISYIAVYVYLFYCKNFNIQHVKPWIYLVIAGIFAVVIPCYTLILQQFHSEQPLINSISTVVTITAVILTLLRYYEQYAFWFITNIVQIVLWATTLKTGTEHIFILVFNCFFAVLNIVYFLKWRKQYLGEKTNEESDADNQS